MVRRSTPPKTIDEQTFAIRTLFRIPELGFTRLNEMHSWLDERAPKAHAIHSHGLTGMNQCAALYVNDIEIAAQCIKVFELELAALPKQTP